MEPTDSPPLLSPHSPLPNTKDPECLRTSIRSATSVRFASKTGVEDYGNVCHSPPEDFARVSVLVVRSPRRSVYSVTLGQDLLSCIKNNVRSSEPFAR